MSKIFIQYCKVDSTIQDDMPQDKTCFQMEPHYDN